ncbi:hypothetical protein FJV41_41370 [Myxococcus llanfairpwllgwyngyllgogerychwyrndrobwllllantysiliogogogochensis]|uniref:Uncharacterized protein n=1 Tax=Myxococcus llanfairpwllgwyngyllgogerychwyrndrobwllllantysiliogogogochensis TaxID=2590453 RepID=A0A540WM07_9BACT|nr:hypothetical protein [Myxococcus llanfairpwllgwyngyllgogerychwyrndrobwllllantysiliogogogochensis]TQF10063.1 hypothetical protein FJV41_41370 [Myxococcus llanfairpwllgwyngyllgogerychwyrndrobwllllantysiliogogogochensis]
MMAFSQRFEVDRMKSVLRGVLCGLMWWVAPAAWAQSEDVRVTATPNTGPSADESLTGCVGEEEKALPLEAGEASRTSTVRRRPNRPVVALDAARATGPIETLEPGSVAPTVDVGSMTTGVQVDQEFLRRIAVTGSEVRIRMGDELERISDVPEFSEVMSLRNAPLISLRGSWETREAQGAPVTQGAEADEGARRVSMGLQGPPRGFQSLAELAPGTPEQLLRESLEEQSSRTSVSSVSKR